MPRAQYDPFELPGFGTTLAKLIGENTFEVRRIIVDDGGKNVSVDVWTDLKLNQDKPMTWKTVTDIISIRLNARVGDEEAEIMIGLATQKDRKMIVDTRVPGRFEINSRIYGQTMIVILEIK